MTSCSGTPTTYRGFGLRLVWLWWWGVVGLRRMVVGGDDHEARPFQLAHPVLQVVQALEHEVG
jgi:hypothetical protein